MFKNFKMSEKTFKRISEYQPYVVLLIIFFIMQSLFTFAFVPSKSMYPTLAIKEFLVANHDSAETFDYGDIVIFHPEAGSSEVWVKRVIGLPGDTIAVNDGHLIRNGEIITEEYLMEDTINYVMDEITVPENCYFMLGDNRNNSFDSHIIGSIPADQFIGKVIFHIRFFPDDTLNSLLKA